MEPFCTEKPDDKRPGKNRNRTPENINNRIQTKRTSLKIRKDLLPNEKPSNNTEVTKKMRTQRTKINGGRKKEQ